jgi:hypothetical protein
LDVFSLQLLDVFVTTGGDLGLEFSNAALRAQNFRRNLLLSDVGVNSDWSLDDLLVGFEAAALPGAITRPTMFGEAERVSMAVAPSMSEFDLSIAGYESFLGFEQPVIRELEPPFTPTAGLRYDQICAACWTSPI